MVASPKVPAPSGLTATSVPTGIRLNWTNPALGALRATQVYESPDDDWANATLVAETNSDTLTIAYPNGTQRWFWIRSKRNSGLVSNRDPNSDTSTVTATAGSPGTEYVRVRTFYQAINSNSTPPVSAGITFKRDGNVVLISGAGATFPGEWSPFGLNPGSTVGDLIQVRAINYVDTPDAEAAAEDTWITIDADRTWSITRTGGEGAGGDTFSCDFEFRLVGTTEILGQCAFAASAAYIP